MFSDTYLTNEPPGKFNAAQHARAGALSFIELTPPGICTRFAWNNKVRKHRIRGRVNTSIFSRDVNLNSSLLAELNLGVPIEVNHKKKCNETAPMARNLRVPARWSYCTPPSN